MFDSKTEIFCRIGTLSKDGYFIFDLSNYCFLYVNQSLIKIFELNEADFLKDPSILLSRVHPEDIAHVKSCVDEVIAERQSKKYMFRVRINEEQEKHLMCSLYILDDHNEHFVCGILEDITVAQQNKIHIEQINARKNVTLEVLFHDLKEPLGMIKLAASSLERKIEDFNEEEFRTSLQFINDMCERNLKLVRSMVNHEFLKSAVVAIKKDRADLVWELKDVVRFYSRSHLSKIRSFHFNSSKDKIYLRLDSMKFLQVINNLISNAIKFTAQDGIIKVFAEDREDTVVISVSDNGIGIPQEIRKNLFEGNDDVLRKGLNGEESGGLGMQIIKAIVDLHGGRIWVISEVGLGSTFHIELPKSNN